MMVIIRILIVIIMMMIIIVRPDLVDPLFHAAAEAISHISLSLRFSYQCYQSYHHHRQQSSHCRHCLCHRCCHELHYIVNTVIIKNPPFQCFCDRDYHDRKASGEDPLHHHVHMCPIKNVEKAWYKSVEGTNEKIEKIWVNLRKVEKDCLALSVSFGLLSSLARVS